MELLPIPHQLHTPVIVGGVRTVIVEILKPYWCNDHLYRTKAHYYWHWHSDIVPLELDRCLADVVIEIAS